MADQSRNQVLADAENHLKQGCEMLQQEATRLRQKQEECDSISKKLTDDSSLIAELNVGGHHFTTSIQTLRNDPNSMLAAMFSGKFDIKRSKDGSFFIDRDGTHFRFILNYLRTGKLTLPEGATFLKELEQEAEFYQIQGILDELKPKPFGESKILTNKEQQQILKGWLPTEMEGEWRLLFRASRDGFGSENFHSKCDNKGPTITIARSGEYIFGGFTEESWRDGFAWIKCSKAFLFSMVNPQGLGPTTMPLITEQKKYAACSDSCSGPSFGSGNDLFITGNAGIIDESCSFLGCSYQCPPGQQSTFFTGANNFIVSNYEVFGLQE